MGLPALPGRPLPPSRRILGWMFVLEALMLLAIPGVLIVTATVTESRRLRHAAQRFRELEDEGEDGGVQLDAFPEFDTAGPRIRMPDGGIADAGPVLRDALRELRAWPPNRHRDRQRS